MRAALAMLVVAALALGCDDSRAASDGSVPGVDAGTMSMTDGGVTGRDATVPTSPLVDPSCTDGMFSEALPDYTADISDLVAGYSSSDAIGFIRSTLDRRYTTGRMLVNEGMASEDCVAFFLGDTSSPQAVIRQMGTIVHECGHFADNNASGFSNDVYIINDSPLRLDCAAGDATDRGGMTFARSRIVNDSFQTARMPCDGSFGRDCDFYADIYLDGDPDNASFEGGDQGYNALFEETVQYVNSLATALAYTNENAAGGGSVSERDGILTFLWYVMRYLRMARLDFPSAYDHLLTGDGGCWRNALLTVWGRAWLYLEATEGMSHLGISDDALTTLATTPELLQEIQRFRDAASCPSP